MSPNMHHYGYVVFEGSTDVWTHGDIAKRRMKCEMYLETLEKMANGRGEMLPNVL
jgi:hypothetical protein